MPDGATIVEVAVPSPLYCGFDYRLPDAVAAARAQPGVRIRVPFGRRQVIGIVLATKQETAVPAGKLRNAIEILDHQPVFSSDLMQLLRWAARYYHHPVGEVFAAALPGLLRKAGRSADSRPQVWKLTEAGRKLPPDSLTRAPRQAATLARLGANPDGLARDALPVPLALLRKLQEKGWISLETDHRRAPAERRPPAAASLDPSAGQAAAVREARAALGQYQAFLLEGVTGSGKTEVYLQVIEPLLEQDRQVLVLVPEIGLTPQLVDRFRDRFGVDISILHSGLTDSQRLLARQRAEQGQAKIILGTRSAVFTPLKKPGLIIVDEEHDSSLKQQEGFRYSARDLAVWRARQLDVPIILGSATPSLESLYNVQQGRYRHLHLPERAGSAMAPKMHLLDLRGQAMSSLLSTPLLEAMENRLKAGGQVLLFLNRRGFSPVLLCHQCGWLAECPRCDSRLTLHQHRSELRCHHCGTTRKVDAFCPACGSSELIAIGEGTEKIEQELTARFPQYPVLRIDRDTTRRKGQLEEALASARKGHARILLGTQMLAKGHHFPDVTLAAILDADQGLFSSDFRASERMAQLIVQVAGRAGRADKPGEVIIQSHHPDHPLLRQLTEQGYDAFAEAALQEREAALFPPYASLALLRADAPHAEHPWNFLQAARELATPWLGDAIQLWGPVPAPMERRAGRYRAQLMVQAQQRPDLQRLLKNWIPGLEAEKSARRVRWSIDVDPVDLF